MPIEKRSVATKIPSTFFFNQVGCFVREARGGHKCLFCYLSSLHWEFKHKCDVQLFLSFFQHGELCIIYVGVYTSILEISTASVGWAAPWRESGKQLRGTSVVVVVVVEVL